MILIRRVSDEMRRFYYTLNQDVYHTMSILPYHILAKRFEEAPDQSHLIPRSFPDVFTTTIEKEFQRLTSIVTCSISYQSTDPYESCDEMFRSVEEDNKLVMRQYDQRFGVSSETYTKYRAVHDLHHCLTNLSFSYEDEFVACDLLGRALSRHNNDEVVQSFVRNEIIYAVALVNEYGYFPEEYNDKFVMDNLLYA